MLLLLLPQSTAPMAGLSHEGPDLNFYACKKYGYLNTRITTFNASNAMRHLWRKNNWGMGGTYIKKRKNAMYSLGPGSV